jgi:hypothetical protein
MFLLRSSFGVEDSRSTNLRSVFGESARHYEIMFLVPESEVEKVPDVIKKVEGTCVGPPTSWSHFQIKCLSKIQI